MFVGGISSSDWDALSEEANYPPDRPQLLDGIHLDLPSKHLLPLPDSKYLAFVTKTSWYCTGFGFGEQCGITVGLFLAWHR